LIGNFCDSTRTLPVDIVMYSAEKKFKNMSTEAKDKRKIEETIEELLRYKRDALQKTWEKVKRKISMLI